LGGFCCDICIWRILVIYALGGRTEYEVDDLEDQNELVHQLLEYCCDGGFYCDICMYLEGYIVVCMYLEG
jgi:hypothetical protein